MSFSSEAWRPHRIDRNHWRIDTTTKQFAAARRVARKPAQAASARAPLIMSMKRLAVAAHWSSSAQ